MTFASGGWIMGVSGRFASDYMEVIGVLVVPLVFKTSVGLNKVPGGFDSHSPPIDESGGPKSKRVAAAVFVLLHHHQVMRQFYLPHPNRVPLARNFREPGGSPNAISPARPTSLQMARPL